MPSSSTLRVGVALGGGSARGYAHIGALSCLERYDLAPNMIAGTSFGAVIGALYATGRSAADLTADAQRMRRRDVFPHVIDFGLHKAALFDGRRLETYFDRLTEGRTFADLERQLVVVTTDVDSGERVLLRQGSLATALRASTSLPGIFAPVEIDGRRLIDGGLASPIPVDTLDPFDLHLAIGIGAGKESHRSKSIRLARRFLRSQVGRGVHRRLGRSVNPHPVVRLGRALAYTADSWLAPTASESRLHVDTSPPIGWLNFHQAARAIRAGDEALERFMPRIRQTLSGLQVA